jgi:hypothetical protein
LFLGKSYDFPTLADSGKEFPWVEVALFIGRHGWCHHGFSRRGTTLLGIISEWVSTKNVHVCFRIGKKALVDPK